MNDLKSITSVAKILGVTRQNVHLMYKSGKFPNACMVEGLILIPISDVENLINSRKKGA